MAKVLAVIYGVVSHVMFLLVFLYLICFLGNFDSLVPKTIDSGTPGPWGIALLVNILLLASTPRIQAVVDSVRSPGGGAKHLCIASQPVGDLVVLAVAADDRGGVGGPESTRS